ncbi:MAG: PAS domain S-box protein [Gammaproteobacteria bacterium]
MNATRRGWAIGAVAFVAIAIAGWVSLSKIETLHASAEYVQHTEQVRLALERSLSTLKDAETGTRGFIVTRNEIVLPPYFDAMKRLESELDQLAALVADNPERTAEAQVLKRLMMARLAPLQGAVEQARSGGPERTRDEVVSAQLEGNRLMNTVRAHVLLMQGKEETLLQARLAAVSSARLTALLTAGGTAVFAVLLLLLVVFVDSRAAARLQQSEQWLATTLGSIGDAVIATDDRGCVKYLNPVAEQLTGWSSEAARARPLEEVFHIVAEDTGHVMESPVVRVLREGTVVGLANHTLLVRRDGSRFPIEDSGAPIKDPRGTIHGVVLVFKDASAQREVAIALATSEERLRLAIEGAELGTWDLDLATNQLVFNPQLYRIMGFAPDTVITREIARSRVLPEDLENLVRSVERASQDSKPYLVEYRITRADDGAERWLSVLGRYMFDEEGKPTRLLGIVNDITERRRLEQRVRQSQKLDALGTLAGGIAHDFNNILSILRGNLLLIEADLPADHPIAPAISEMSRACARARDLVRQILTFGRQQEQDRKLLSLADVIPEALKLLRSTIPATIEIRGRIASALPTVLADASQIHQIMMNLGINASQAIGRGAGVITVELDETHVDGTVAAHSPDLHEGHYVRLRLGDSGSGMTREVLERIFEPFFTTKPLGSGTGLGLAVVRGIVKSHDGAITVYSEPGKGTQFHLYFPVVMGTASQPPQAGPPPTKGNGQRILYLDDEDALVLLARRLLERLGYQVSGFVSAAEALAAFEAAPDQFDLVLSDLSMPGINGIDVARRVLQIRPEIPVLLASGYVRPEDVEIARSIGVRDVIWKPTTINEMGELLGRILAKIIPRA